MSKLPLTGISTTLVASTIGVGSNDVGTLCTKARSGGVNGSAFRIVENGFTNTDGKLIAESLPFFNIWSSEAPGEWTLPVNALDYVYYRLKRDSSLSKYSYQLHSYREYEHTAVAPMLGGGSSDMLVRVESSSEVAIYAYCNLGSYDWTKLGAEKCRIDVYKGGTKVANTASVNLVVDSGIAFNDIILYEDLRYPVVLTYNLYLTLLNDAGNAIGRLPINATYVLTVNQNSIPSTHVNSLNIEITLPVTGVWSNMMTEVDYYYRTFTPDLDFLLEEEFIYLQSITYTSYAANGNVMNVQTVTQFTSNDNPQLITKQKAGTSYIFKAAKRPYAGAEWVEVTMTYTT